VSVAPARRQPRHLGAALQAAVQPLAPATLLGAVQSAWGGAVGERVAAEATPVAERDGVVTVACRSAAWAQELDLLAGEVVSKLRAELPDGADLQGLRFTASQNPD
jgi:predicted nucleic acid-binding Zn ribbon protein